MHSSRGSRYTVGVMRQPAPESRIAALGRRPLFWILALLAALLLGPARLIRREAPSPLKVAPGGLPREEGPLLDAPAPKPSPPR